LTLEYGADRLTLEYGADRLAGTPVNNYHYSLSNNPVPIHFTAEARNSASGNPPIFSDFVAFFLVEYDFEDVRKRPKYIGGLPHVCILLYLTIVQLLYYIR
jgi:hypothetical protein